MVILTCVAFLLVILVFIWDYFTALSCGEDPNFPCGRSSFRL